MTTGTVVVLPDGGVQHATARGHVLNSGYPAVAVTPAPGPDATLAARTCAWLSIEQPAPPLTVVAFGAAALLLPSIALAQRAAHRRVQEYVLVEPELPPVTDGWPDAPVTVFTDDAHSVAVLRGWVVRPAEELADWSPGA